MHCALAMWPAHSAFTHLIRSTCIGTVIMSFATKHPILMCRASLPEGRSHLQASHTGCLGISHYTATRPGICPNPNCWGGGDAYDACITHALYCGRWMHGAQQRPWPMSHLACLCWALHALFYISGVCDLSRTHCDLRGPPYVLLPCCFLLAKPTIPPRI